MSGLERHYVAGESRGERLSGWTARVAVLAWVVAMGASAIVASCGGTTGHEGLTLPPSPGAMLDATVDAPVESGEGGDAPSDAGAVFDTSLQYVDQALPEAQAPTEGGASGAEAGGAQWPVCPPDIPAFVDASRLKIPVGDSGSTVTETQAEAIVRTLAEGGLSTPVYDPNANQNWEIPAVFANVDGGEAPAPSDSPCASQVYLGSPQCDLCAKLTNVGVLYSPFGLNNDNAVHPTLPPCGDLWDAGVAVAGPGAGKPVHDLCMDLFNCIVATRCITPEQPNLAGCICSLPLVLDCAAEAGPGPCTDEVKAAMQIPSDTPAASQWSTITHNDLSVYHGVLYQPVGELEQLFAALASECANVCPYIRITSDAGAEAGDGG